MDKKERPSAPLAVTMGCPAGVGPEIILKALCRHGRLPPVVVIGDVDILRRAKELAGLKEMDFITWRPGDMIPADRSCNSIHVYPATHLSPDEIVPGRPTAVTGSASFSYIEAAIELGLEGMVSGIVTAPISKTGLRLAGYDWPGHTEILAEKTGSQNFLMMMAGSRLNVTLVTIHVPLKQVPFLITEQLILKTIEITCRGLKQDFSIRQPRIAVCGLNPHAGEGGMFGREELDIITPACKAARGLDMDVTGPLPPDTVFYQAARGNFDAVVCQYHDQGLIPFKLLHFRDGVNVTLGLPIVRTSVDHGTAYDIAGTGRADCSSLCAAIELASKISANRAVSS